MSETCFVRFYCCIKKIKLNISWITSLTHELQFATGKVADDAAQFDEVEKQKMKEKTALEEQERVREIESLRQRHAEVLDEIDQVFVCIPQC